MPKSAPAPASTLAPIVLIMNELKLHHRQQQRGMQSLWVQPTPPGHRTTATSEQKAAGLPRDQVDLTLDGFTKQLP